jgi:cytochrome c peroxidase
VLAAHAGSLGSCAPSGGWARQCQDDLGLSEANCLEAVDWRLPSELPPARGNRYADDPRAAALGRSIFFDAGFATVPGVSCATCHLPDDEFAESRATSEVIAGMPGGRNSPSLLVAAWNQGYWFWDGRADSLWSQPLFAFENEIEMGTTRLSIAHRMHENPEYRDAYQAVFGALPDLSDAARFPPRGRPGDASWEAMAGPDRDAVNRVVANVGKALEAYMRRLATGPSRVDRYLDGDRSALTDTERRGFARFIEGGCTACHDGPMLTDDGFHLATMEDTDRGRAAGIEVLLASPFSSAGPYFDVDAGEALPLPLGPAPEDERAFRTPSLRNVTLTAPYAHDGARTLSAILTTPSFFYEPGDEVVIEAFLGALVGEPPPPEWTAPP